MMKWITGCKCTEKWVDVAPLALRIAVGLAFAMHGYQKLSGGLEGTAGFLAGIGFPLASLFAALLIAGELIGGIALMLGYLTHMSAKVLTFIALVALLTVHITHGFFLSGGGFEYILVLLAGALSLMITGAGKYSLDAWMKKTV